MVIPANARREFELREGSELIIFGDKSHNFLGAMTEEAFREMLGRIEQRVGDCISRVNERREILEKVSDQLDAHKERKSNRNGQKSK